MCAAGVASIHALLPAYTGAGIDAAEKPAGKRSDQHWQKAGPRDESSPDKNRHQHGRTSCLVPDFQLALADWPQFLDFLSRQALTAEQGPVPHSEAMAAEDSCVTRCQ